MQKKKKKKKIKKMCFLVSHVLVSQLVALNSLY